MTNCRWLLLPALLLVTACATVQDVRWQAGDRQAMIQQRWVIDGRFSLIDDDTQVTGGIRLRHIGNRFDMVLSSPVGGGLARIYGDYGGEVTLLLGSRVERGDAATLSRLLKLPLAVEDIAFLLRGRRPYNATVISRSASDITYQIGEVTAQLLFTTDGTVRRLTIRRAQTTFIIGTHGHTSCAGGIGNVTSKSGPCE